MRLIFTKNILFLSILLVSANKTLCPTKCNCRRINQQDQLKLRCGKTIKISNLDEIDLLNVADNVVQFNLSNNLLETFFPKVQLKAVQKLDLSKNRLIDLQNNQFAELPNLRSLDISSNSISNIEPLAFAKLEKLERLRLNQNQISSIGLGTFTPLVRLNTLDISGNPLTCDCSLLWLTDWSQKKSVKLLSNPTCNSPPLFKSTPLRKIKIGFHINCKSALNFPLLQMKPDENQVVFEGDMLNLQCTAPSISDSVSPKLKWTWLDSDPKLYFEDISTREDFVPSTGLVTSSLTISKLRRNHTGIWNCVLVSAQGNYSKGITIVVISEDTEYCPITTTSDNKGTYTWPRTVVNYTAMMPCEPENLNYDANVQKASYSCSPKGTWTSLNTTMCSYILDTTRALEQFSKVNSSILESAKHFQNYTSSPDHFKDATDVVYAVRTMENYLTYLTPQQIGGVLMDVTNNLMKLPKAYLGRESCARLVNITEELGGAGTAPLLQKPNIATGLFGVNRRAFSNLKCTWYAEKALNRRFYCNSQEGDTSDLDVSEIEASITIPETLFVELEEQGYGLDEKIYNISISMYSSNKLFPVQEEREGKEDVTSVVVGAKLVGIAVTNLTEPVSVMLKNPPSVGDTVPIPVWWSPRTGTWSREGCDFSHEYQDHVVFDCYNFGYYGLLRDVSNSHGQSAGAKFKLSHPAIYVGSFILFTSLLVVIVTYLMCYGTIQMPKKAKHSLINLWTTVSALCFMYVFGIYQTEDARVCQVVGMLLHYFTLASLLWMCVGVNCMYKRLSKNDIMELQDDDLPTEQPIKKPILGLYFVGWGVPIIVCGISAAINIRDYATPTYCFLRAGPPLSALYIPVAILLAFLGVFSLLIRCAIYSSDANGHLSEGTQATENVDLDLLEPNFSNPEARSVATTSTKTASSEVEDPEHAPSTQLKAYIIFLILYVSAWLSCAFATVEPHYFVRFESDLFSIGYAVFATVLSAFTIFFYCVARSDVRGQWIQLKQRKQSCFRSRNVSDTVPNVPQIHIQPIVADLQLNSRSSSRSSSRTKSVSHASNILKGAVDLNQFNETPEAKINNVNLIVLHRQQYRNSVIPNIIENPTNAAEVFYNPHQSIVARKFFKRQKRHMMKRNNLVPRTRDAGALSIKDNSSIDQLFGTSSKVNNANIHVEHVRKKHEKNPNIFSDSADEYECVRVPPNILDTSKHKTRKKSNSQSLLENNMRSVSQQCTLEYSSENVSDSILDKTSPEKAEEGEKADETRIYVNPAHQVAKGVQNRSSSVSVSDLDELYQQIRRGPKEAAVSRSRSFINNFSLTRNSPCFSDSDVKREEASDVETTV